MTQLPPGGPRVVALGGGHGLAVSLTAIRRYASEITAVVSVADDGGSSGRLRAQLGLSPPGDVRRCLVALAGDPGVWSQAFEHRFDRGDLAGHPLGNLVIAGLAQAIGDFNEAVAAAGRILASVGEVVPATTGPAVLRAWLEGQAPGAEPVVGQVAVATAGPIRRLEVGPVGVSADPRALAAMVGADQVVLGPGSLYTSVLATAAVGDLRQSLAETRAQKVYVCNLRSEEPEAKGYDVADHVAALIDHGVEPDVVLCDETAMPVGRPRVHWVRRQVAGPGGLAHDPVLLAAALDDLARGD